MAIKARLKATVCPYCCIELVVDDGVVTCQDECDLSAVREWHPETQSRIDAVAQWQQSQPSAQ